MHAITNLFSVTLQHYCLSISSVPPFSAQGFLFQEQTLVPLLLLRLLSLICPGCLCKPSLLLGPREVMAFSFPVLSSQDRSDVTPALKCGV